jgi:IclR family transcriptional regulator, mhp operon transcriptional activator
MGTLTPAQGQQYKEVRGLSRGLQVLEALNRMPGGVGTTTELAVACQLHRTTVKRLLETLRRDGFVRPGTHDGQYGLTFEVRRLSEGFEDEAWVEKVASPAMQASVRELLWPCDIASLEGGFMVVRESTHRWSSLSQHRARIGEKMPLFVTALGRAYMAACREEELQALLDLLGKRGDWIGEMARDEKAVRAVVRETRRRGWAVNRGEWVTDPDFAAIALPVMSGERLLAAINLVFPKDAVSPADLRTRYVPRLRQLAGTIGRNSRPWIER